ncbi:hypothetical protein BKA67DRAFT_536775 [Truncatella angustata]|uniref:NAD-dependent epimerase/dehydratase domain-containing protein n=1 Tax=Truncatella angustata TaxID=152316 RepID=A0A9P8UIN4_9PEZI|nr:uncharacterized protein BKA67DRAFT_536775 [Truncatella angustata]KAH6653078.1 hypothetical protein BKA67DRAFT_536775 [Truncatella angustata]
MSSKGLVLVTGANGFIGARTVEAFLNAGYSVRGTVRSSTSAQGLLTALPDAAAQGRLEIAEVPDITLPGAFDEALRGVTAVAHLATPVSFSFTDANYVVGTAVKGSKSILESAFKEPGVKHFVLMSSVVAILGEKPQGYVFTEADWNEQAPDLVAKLGNETPGPVIYSASKTLAERDFWKFREERKPNFTMTAINPVFVAGPPLVLPSSPDNINETTEFIWKVFSGQGISEKTISSGPFVDVRDVARLTVFGVEHGQDTDAQRYLAQSGWGSPQAVADVLCRQYPDRKTIICQGTPESDYLADFKTPPQAPQVDTSKAIRATGQGWIDLETMVLDAAKAFEKYL